MPEEIAATLENRRKERAEIPVSVIIADFGSGIAEMSDPLVNSLSKVTSERKRRGSEAVIDRKHVVVMRWVLSSANTLKKVEHDAGVEKGRLKK